MLNDAQNVKLLSKLRRAMEVFEPYIFTKVAPLPFAMYETAERLETIPEQSLFALPEQRPSGLEWGGEGCYCWFLTQYTPPEELAGQPLYLYPELGGYEAMLWVDGQPYGTYATKIVVTRHGNHYCDRICAAATPGTPIALAIEFYAGHYVVGEQPFERRVHGDFRFTAKQISVCTKNQAVLDFILDLRVLLQLAEKLPEISFRRAELLNVLTQVHSVLYYDPEAVDAGTWLSSLAEARRIMAPALSCRNGTSAPTAALIGHSHIDTAWLWTLEETTKKIARTAANQFNLLDQYPEYRFIQSAAYHTWLMEQHYPQIFEQLQRRVAEGRFELNGAVWVECDCNIPSGESLVRQFLWGTRYIRSRFGAEQKAFWLPDTFGYSAALPQIMRGFGVTGFLTTKLAWNDTNRFPYETFVWRGIDGSCVNAHFFVIDTWPDPAGLLERIEGIGYKDHIARKQAFSERLIAFGYGDGGGGPQFEMIEAARRLHNLEGCPKAEYTSVNDFVKKLEAAAPTLPVYDGELYLELHRGTLTAKQQIKKNNRMAENLLRMLELSLSRQAVDCRTPADGKVLHPLWNTLLVNQFHDILPGSCIAPANDRSLRDMAQLLQNGTEMLHSWFAPAQNCYTILNPLDEPCKDVFYLPPLAPGMTTSDPAVTLQPVTLSDGQAATAVYGLERPALGAAVLHLVPGKAHEPESPFVYTGRTLLTPLLEVELDEAGHIVSLITRADGMQWAGGPMNTLLLAEDVSAGWDGWDIDADCLMKLHPAGCLTEQKVTVDGSREFRLHSRYDLGTASFLEQDMIFRANSTLIEWQTVLHWHEKHRVLKVSFPTNLRAKNARHEIQFGCIERPTTTNNVIEQAMFERCNHRYTDLSEPGRGLSIFNDCKYGISVQGGTMALTLAKGGTRPDERGDEGIYSFRYGIQPHTGGFSAEVVRRGMRFDRLPVILESNAPAGTFLMTDCRSVIVDSVKPCEDVQNAVIVRLYECEGSRTGTFSLLAGFPVKEAVQCDLAENEIHPVELASMAPMKPFEIRTIKIRY